MSDCKHYKKTGRNDSNESAKNHIPASGRASALRVRAHCEEWIHHRGHGEHRGESQGEGREQFERRGRGENYGLNLCVPPRTLCSNPCASSVVSVTSVVNLRFNAQLGGLTPSRSPAVGTKQATLQTTAVRDAIESPAGIDGRTAAIGPLLTRAPGAEGRSVASS